MSFLYQKDACSNKSREQGIGGAALYWVRLVGTGSICSFVLAFNSQAQDVPEGAQRIILDLRNGLEWSDNPDLLVDGESRLINRTRLDFSLERRASIDTLTVGLGGDLLLGEDSDDTVENADARLRWDRDVGRSRLGLGLTFESTALDSTSFATGESVDSVDFDTFDGGTRRSSGIVLDGAFGIESPLGASYSLSQTRIRYRDTADPSLLDADQSDLSFSITAAVDRTTTVGLIGSLFRFDEKGAGALDTQSVRLGGELRTEITPALSGRFAVGQQETEQSGAETSSTDGIFVDGELTWIRPNGTAGLVFDSPIEANGRRTTVQIQRELELPRGGFGYSVGLSRAEGLSTRPLFGLNWEYEMPRATFTADLSQTPTTTRDNVETINSVLSLNFNQQLNTRSSLDVLLSLRDADEEGIGASDTRRVGLDLTYRQDLAQDWNLVGQFSTVRIIETGSADRNANTVFLGLEKRFGWN
ncbi:hypothetical protein [uncultured Tateyamaria sp.]|uniref:hypothetical protein n=1 Tax=uncultured Tateyamaria sp. TaxID=455651 RepID=UPI00262BCB4E|nr:hypothetical protein [uncultured Tateyamaria sp.]